MFPFFLFLVFLYATILRKNDKKELFSDLFIALEFSILLSYTASPYNYILLSFLLMIYYGDHLARNCFNTRLNFLFFKTIFHMRAKGSSLKNIQPHFSLLLFLFITPYILSLDRIAYLFLAPLLILSFIATYYFPSTENIFYLLQKKPFLKKNKTRYNLKKIREFIPQGEISTFVSSTYPLLRKHREFTQPRITNINLKESKPHILFLFLESFKFFAPKELENTNLTPYFNKLSQQSLYFENFISPATLTFRSLLAANYGIYPFYGGEFSTTKQIALNTPLIGIPHILKKTGYQSHLVCGYPKRFDQYGKFFATHGFDTIKEQADIEQAMKVETNAWGVHDQYYFDYLVDYIKTLDKPTFINSGTITNHYPFIAPKSYSSSIANNIQDPLQKAFASTLHYTDQMLERFINKLENENLLDNMILFIGGDHGFPIEYSTRNNQLFFMKSLYKESVQVPFLIYQKGISPKKISSYHSYVDLMPTIIDLFDLQSTHHSMGKSLLRTCPKSSVYFGNFMNEIPILSHFGSTQNKAQALESHLYSLFNQGNKFCKSKDHSVVFDEKESLTNQVLKKSLSNCKRLYSLNLDDAIHLTDEALHSLPTSLEELSIKNSLFTSEGFSSLLKRCKKIHTLDISNAHLLDPLDNILTHCSQLLSLTIGSSPYLDTASINALPLTLEQLNYTGPLDNENLDTLIERKLNLKELTLGCTHIHSLKIPSLVKINLTSLLHLDSLALKELLNLTELHIGNINPISDSHILNLDTIQLRALSIKNAHEITNIGFNALLNHPLRVLSLENCINFTKEKANTILAFPQLRALSIKDAPQSIVEHLKTNKRSQLKIISL